MKNYLKQKIKKKKKIKIDIKFKKYMIRIVQIFERYLIKKFFNEIIHFYRI